MSSQRRAEQGERCTCGRQAMYVYAFEADEYGPDREIGYCGVADGGDWFGPCPFCGERRHKVGPCPQYSLRGGDRR